MISVFINSMTSGGAEKIVLTLLEQYRNAGEEVELICIEREQYYAIPKGIKVTYLTDYESLERSPLTAFYVILCAWRLMRHIKKHNITIVQSHLVRASFINIFARLLGARHFTQVIFHVSLAFDHKPRLLRPVYKFIYNSILSKADSLVSICEVMKNYLNQYLGLDKHGNHVVIYNPHNLSELADKAQQPTPRFQFQSDKKYIVWAGRMVKRKRTLELLEAFHNISSLHTNVELLFLGTGEEMESLENRTKALNITERVHFLGHQDNPYPYIAHSDIMVLASDKEGLPNIIIESIAVGTPVISSDCVSGPREILHPDTDLNIQLKDKLEYGAYGILYPVGNVKLLTEALRCMVEDDSLREHYTKVGLERSKMYDAQKISDIYRQSFPTSTPVAIPFKPLLQNPPPLD